MGNCMTRETGLGGRGTAEVVVPSRETLMSSVTLQETLCPDRNKFPIIGSIRRSSLSSPPFPPVSRPSPASSLDLVCCCLSRLFLASTVGTCVLSALLMAVNGAMAARASWQVYHFKERERRVKKEGREGAQQAKTVSWESVRQVGGSGLKTN